MSTNQNVIFIKIFKELTSNWDVSNHVIANRCKAKEYNVELIRNAIQYNKESVLEIYHTILNNYPDIIDKFFPIQWDHEIKLLANPSGLLYSPLTKSIIFGALDKNGYLLVHGRYVIDGVIHCRSFRWHRLIAMAFIPNPDPEYKTQINHIDANKLNNAISNLEWATPQENNDHKIRMGLQKTGEDSYQSIYTNDQIRKVCELLSQGIFSPKAIEKKTGVHRKMVIGIRNGKKWKGISREYTFPSMMFDTEGRWVDENGIPHGEKERELPDQHKYTESQIREACEMKCKRFKIADIMKKTGVGRRTIVRLGGSEDNYRNISKDYNFPKTIRKDGTIGRDKRWFTDDQIMFVCEMMMDPNNTIEDVCSATGISRKTIRRFHSKDDQYSHITDNYIFPEFRKGVRGTWIRSAYR